MLPRGLTSKSGGWLVSGQHQGHCDPQGGRYLDHSHPIILLEDKIRVCKLLSYIMDLLITFRAGVCFCLSECRIGLLHLRIENHADPETFYPAGVVITGK